MRLLLSGIVGSTAYGLAGAGSDVDRLGVFAAPTVAFHGLHPPRESVVSTNPDRTLHEAGKWCRLALAGNPTAMELVWLPETLYEVRTELGDRLIGIRTAFLSAPRVRAAYLGYAAQQFRKIESRLGAAPPSSSSSSASASVPTERIAKHARHLARLVHQGRTLYATGQLPIRLANPEFFLDFGERVAAGELGRARALLAKAEREFTEIRTPLPEHPDESTVERWLLDVRAAGLAWPSDPAPQSPPPLSP